MKLFSKSISCLRNREAHRAAVILGNGPSVRSEVLSYLAASGAVVIGMNASTMLEAEYRFTADYYVLSDLRFLNHPEKRQWATSALASETIRIVRTDLRPYDDAEFARRTFYIPALSRDGFSLDLACGFHYGCTTTMLGIQLAWYLGCRRVALLGVDLRYREDSPRFYKEENPQLEDAFTSVQLRNIACAGKLMREYGGELIGCSEHSLLRPHLPFMPAADLLEAIMLRKQA